MRSTSRASLQNLAGIVAEKSSVCRSGGSTAMIFWTSGQKPMSIMRSASSSTRHLQPHEVGRAVPHVVHQAPGRRDDDVGAGLERALLRIHRHAAEHGDGRHRRVIRQADQRILDLHRQLARRRQDQRARVRLARGVAERRLLAQQLLQNRGANASVLPVPVSAQATMSWPSRARGMTAPCTGRVPSKPRSLQALHQLRMQRQRAEGDRGGVRVDRLPRNVGARTLVSTAMRRGDERGRRARDEPWRDPERPRRDGRAEAVAGELKR